MRRQFALEESELGLKLKTCCAALRSAHLSARQILPGCGFDSVEGFNLASRLGFCCHFHQLEDLERGAQEGCVCVQDFNSRWINGWGALEGKSRK